MHTPLFTIANIDKNIVHLSGTIYTARDAAHKLLCEMISNKQKLPFDLNGSCIYYCGPTPARNNEIIGSCGPTSSTRMDAYTPLLLQHGLKAIIGKGDVSQTVNSELKRHNAIYFKAIGGCGALYKQCVLSAKVIAFKHLGCEAVYELVVKDMPLVTDN